MKNNLNTVQAAFHTNISRGKSYHSCTLDAKHNFNTFLLGLISSESILTLIS